MSEQTKPFDYPTQPFDLPSQGLVYPENHPLSNGKIELHIPSAKHEDILTNPSYIHKGIVFDKLLEAVIASPKINIDDLITGDKDAILLATRILAYGQDYTFSYEGEPVTVNLSALEPKPLDEAIFKKGSNEFEFELPITKHLVTFKFLTGADEKKIEAENAGMLKINKTWSGFVTTPMKYMIVAVDGNRDSKTTRAFVDRMPIRDSKAFRDYVAKITPDIERKFDFERKNGEVTEGLPIPMTVEFFWPK